MSTFKSLSLKTNPFRITPATDSNELIWAGFPKVKERIEKRIQRSIYIPNTSLILNWGEYGSGKTHAAKFFCKHDVLTELAGKSLSTPFSLTISFPKSKEPVKDIFNQIIDRIDFNTLREKLHESSVVKSDTLPYISDNLFINNLFRVIFAESETENDVYREERVKSYLYGDAKELLKQGVLRKLSSDIDYTEFLGALFSLMTFEKKAYSCVILWIDEFEDISILNSTNISNINNFIRTIIDKTPNNLLIFLNLTQSAMIDVQDLGEYLQEAVKSRIRDRIEFNMPDKDDLKLYIKELLNNPIFRDGIVDNEYVPFSEKVIDMIIEDLGAVSLRRYNEAFSILLENAAFDGKTSIDIDYYNNIKSEIIGWK